MRNHRTTGLDQLGPVNHRSGTGMAVRRGSARFTIGARVATGLKLRKVKPAITLAKLNLPPVE